MKKHLSILVLFCVLTGCTSVAHLKTSNSDVTGSNTNAGDIKVYVSDNSLNDDYDILGEVVVAADAGTNAASVVSKLRTQAAELGADSIINLRIEFEYGYMTVAIKATGTAVKTN